jgi:hypothetical protein
MSWNQIAPQTPWNENRATWMSQLPDTLAVQDLSIPGTHDSAALKGFTHSAVSETQWWKIEEQLNKRAGDSGGSDSREYVWAWVNCSHA